VTVRSGPSLQTANKYPGEMAIDRFKYVIIGAGLAGCTLAERIATQLHQRVLIIERRNHVGGNTYDYFNDDGIRIQKYGPHIFHTNSEDVWRYLANFTEWNDYVHRVIAIVNGKEFFLPINLETMEKLYDTRFTPEELTRFFERRRIPLPAIRNSRDVILSQVGEELYDLFFKNYTKKQWGVYPEELDPQVMSRLPVRVNRDTRYFSDTYQGIPTHGFNRMFDKMLSSTNIHVLLNTDYKDVLPLFNYDRLIYTGPIDSFFDYQFGRLPYRSLDFRFETLRTARFQNAAVVNYPNDFDYTRITEFKHLYLQEHPQTTICYEYPKAEGDPYYPIPNPHCRAIYEKYASEADRLEAVYFIGRLAEYKYLNMDQVVHKALLLFNKLKTLS